MGDDGLGGWLSAAFALVVGWVLVVALRLVGWVLEFVALHPFLTAVVVGLWLVGEVLS